MAKKNSLTHAPYLDGSLTEYVMGGYPNSFGWGWGENRIQGEWVENEPFQATLFYKTWERGRSAVRVIWEDAEGHTYPMFMTDMDKLLAAGTIGVSLSPREGGQSLVIGTWQVVKRGANFGIALVEA